MEENKEIYVAPSSETMLLAAQSAFLSVSAPDASTKDIYYEDI